VRGTARSSAGGGGPTARECPWGSRQRRGAKRMRRDITRPALTLARPKHSPLT
jgi:hypothetical protein